MMSGTAPNYRDGLPRLGTIVFPPPHAHGNVMYIIVVGAGNIGTPLIEIATEGGNEVVVVERDAERADARRDSSTVSSSTTTRR